MMWKGAECFWCWIRIELVKTGQASLNNFTSMQQCLMISVGPALLDPVYLYLNISTVVVILLTVLFQCSSRPFS